MHSVDPTTEAMIRSVLAYAENRLRLHPVPLDQGSRDPAELAAAQDAMRRNFLTPSEIAEGDGTEAGVPLPQLAPECALAARQRH